MTECGPLVPKKEDIVASLRGKAADCERRDDNLLSILSDGAESPLGSVLHPLDVISLWRCSRARVCTPAPRGSGVHVGFWRSPALRRLPQTAACSSAALALFTGSPAPRCFHQVSQHRERDLLQRRAAETCLIQRIPESGVGNEGALVVLSPLSRH